MYGAGGRDTLVLDEDLAIVCQKTFYDTVDRCGRRHNLRLHEHWNCVAAAVEAEVCTTCPHVARRCGCRGHDGCLLRLLFHFACWILGIAQFPAGQAVGAQRHRWISYEQLHTSPQDLPGAVIIAIMTTNT